MHRESTQSNRKRALSILVLLILMLPGMGACLGDSFNNIYDPTSPGGLTNNLILLTALGAGFGGTDNTLLEGSPSTISTHEISLTAAPISPVTVTVSSADGQLLVGGASQATMVFTEANYRQAQSVSITAKDDTLAEGNHTGVLTHSVSSADPAYSSSTFEDRTLNITDDEPTNLSESGLLSIGEGRGISVYSFSLASEPTADVTVTLTAADGQSTIDGLTTKSYTFTTTDWNIAQTFTSAAVDDLVVEANPHPATVTVTYASASGGYASTAATTIVFSVTEDDFPG